MKRIELPALPASWEELTGRQMIEMNRIRRTSKSESEFKLKVFCFLEGIEPCRDVAFNDKGEQAFFYRSIGKDGKPFPLFAWQVHEAVEQFLGWVSEPCNRLSEVLERLAIDGRTFAGTGYAMTRMTYQQHQYAQRYFSEIQRTEMECAKALLESEPDTGKLDKLMDYLRMSRRLFMATVFTPECKVMSRTVDGKVVSYDTPQTDFVFGTEQIQKNADVFREVKDEVIDAVIQHFNGVMMHYRKIYPKLFKEGMVGKTDPIRVEESTLNILQGELKFANYQTIYDSNAPFILGKLHAIILKSEEIERMNQKMRQKH